MEEIVKSDWFFFITTISVAVITVLLSVVIVYGFIILKKVNKFVETVKEEGEELIEDLQEVRARIKSESGLISKVPAVIAGLMQLFKIKKSKSKK